MDLRTLKTFHMIVKHGSFNRAAEALNYVQSTITMQIQKLESDLGVKLIERGKHIKLTEAGRIFYKQSLQIVKSMEQLQTDILDLQLGETGNIRLGATEPTASFRLPKILKRFFSLYPKIHVSLVIANTPVLSEKLIKGEIDMALCTAPDLGNKLFFNSLFSEEFVVIMQENHPLAQKEEIAPDDFLGHRLLITSETCPYRKKLEMILQETGTTSLETMEIGSITALKYYVESGLGIALVPKILLKTIPVGTTIRPINGGLVEMNFGILYKTSEYPMNLAWSRLYEHLKQELYN
jgi:LysR family transcriptional regulator, regulator of the ytmI operon